MEDPNNVPSKRKRKKYSKENFDDAIRWAKEGTASLRYISKTLGVPVQTISDNIRGTHMRGNEGSGPLFTDAEEKLIVEFVFMRQRIHRPVAKHELLQFLGEWLRSDQRRFKLGKQARPSKNYL